MALHNENPWQWWLEDSPLAQWGVFRPRTGSRGFINYWRGKQDRVWGDYKAAQGQQTLAGQAPDIRYQDFLQDYPFQEKFRSLPPSERGESNRMFSPRTRFLFG